MVSSAHGARRDHGGGTVIVQPVTEMPSGTTLGKYDILRRLATGGMAEIYLARGRGQAGFEKLVVLKRILPQVAADPVFVRMFLEEAKLAATLRHPHIADVWEVDCVDGMYFYTMEYIHGQDVRAIRAASRKRNERMPLAIAVGIVASVAEALEYAHDRTAADGSPLDLVHRDISSSNILVSYDGAVKLLDFGIAHAADRTESTRTGSIKGKVPYMSPEQCQGHRLDRRSDLFSLGTVLYELSVGRRPYRGESDFAVMEQIVRSEPAPPSQTDPTYPPALEAIVMRMLARDLEARYQSADELIADLEQFQTSNQLWVSSKVISRYMRSLFWDNIEAWEQARRDGTLGHHLTSTHTDRRPESVTPPSAFPIATTTPSPAALPRAAVPATGPIVADTRVEVRRSSSSPVVGEGRPSDAVPLPFGVLPDVSGPMAAVTPPPRPAVEMAVAVPIPTPASMPVVPPPAPSAAMPIATLPVAMPVASPPSVVSTRSAGSRKLVIAIAASVVLVGVGIGVLASSSNSDEPATPTSRQLSAPDTVHVPATPAPTQTPASAPTTAPVATPPASTPAVVSPAPIEKPNEAPAPTNPRIEAIDPDGIELEPGTAAAPQRPTPTRPAAARTERKRPDQKSPGGRKVIKLKPEEATWDPNSPVLPRRH